MLIIDRIEEDFAVCQDDKGGYVNIPLNLLPEGAGEGTALREIDGGYILDSAYGAERRKVLENKMNRLFNRNKG